MATQLIILQLILQLVQTDFYCSVFAPGSTFVQQVSVIEKELDYMKSEYVDLRTKFKEHKKSTDQEIMALKRLLHSSSGTTM